MSIWITGDCHADFYRFKADSFYEQKEFTEESYVIILGDFGLIWERENESKNEKYWLDWLHGKPFTTLFLDGNHENHVRLSTYPVKEWHGGNVHEIRPNVLHLMRGEVFNIEDKKFFVMGGASSHDIQDGILDYDDPLWKDQAKFLDNNGRYMYRVKGLSWWEEEIPNDEDLENGLNNLEKHNNKVDFILTHSPSSVELILLGGERLYETDKLTNYLDIVKNRVDYKRHFFGHMHINRAVNSKDIAIYDQIIRIN